MAYVALLLIIFLYTPHIYEYLKPSAFLSWQLLWMLINLSAKLAVQFIKLLSFWVVTNLSSNWKQPLNEIHLGLRQDQSVNLFVSWRRSAQKYIFSLLARLSFNFEKSNFWSMYPQDILNRFLTCIFRKNIQLCMNNCTLRQFPNLHYNIICKIYYNILE